jgi:HK97 family phage major capsid protein
MAFKIWEEAQYRSASIEDLETRKNEIAAELVNADSETTTADLEVEAERCLAAIARVEKAAELRSKNIAAVSNGAGKVVERHAFGSEGVKTDSDPYDTAEYRNAFMDYCVRGVQIPVELREGGAGTVTTGVTLSSDNAPQVPSTMQREIIKAMRDYGTIWNEVRKLNVKGGIWFRVIDIIPTATWLTENNVSDEQKVQSDAMVTFTFFELECRMAQSLLSAAVTFDDFQAMFVPAVAEAMVTAIEAAIMNGNGTSQPLGILKDARVTTLQTNDPRKVTTVEMTAAEFADWKAWRKKAKAVIPTKYRTGKWYMNFATFDCYVDTMADDNNAPVSTSYDAVTGEEISRLCGFKVEKVQDAILPDFDSAAAGDVVAIYGDMRNYAVNTQPGMPLNTIRWIDHDTNKEKIKSLVAIDGKVLDPYGFILIKKKASA